MYLRIEIAEDKVDAVWEKDLLPFLRNVWPGEAKNMTPRVFAHFADTVVRLCESFPSAVDELARFATVSPRWISLPMVLARGARGSYSHCDKHPAAALKMLSLLTKHSIGSELMECLENIERSDNSLANRSEFKMLRVRAKELEV